MPAPTIDPYQSITLYRKKNSHCYLQIRGTNFNSNLSDISVQIVDPWSNSAWAYSPQQVVNNSVIHMVALCTDAPTRAVAHTTGSLRVTVTNLRRQRGVVTRDRNQWRLH